MERIGEKLGFSKLDVAEPVGRSGGMMIMWNKEVNIEF